MSRGYDSPTVEFFDSEQLPEYNPPEQTAFGIIGVTLKGPVGPTKISSIRELHDTFGYSALGTNSAGKKIYSKAIAEAERILKCSSLVIFCRKEVSDTELAKLTVTGDDLSFTVANSNVGVQAVVITKDTAVSGATQTYTISVKELDQYGDVVTTVIASKVIQGDVKAAIEYEGTLTNVTVGNAFPGTGEGETSKTIAITADPLSFSETSDEFSYFSNIDAVDVSILSAPYGDILVGKLTTSTEEAIEEIYDSINEKLIAVDNVRKDCMVLLDYPEGMSYLNFVTFMKKSLYASLDDSQAAIAYPDITYNNPYSNVTMILPSSAILSYQMSYTDANKACWFAPAGFGDSKGLITDATKVNVTLTKDMRDTIYDLRVNPVVNFVGQGIVQFGNVTLKAVSKYAEDSVYVAINVRRLANYVRKLIRYVSLETLFEPNDSITWKAWKNNIDPKLREIKENRGLQNFKTVMDTTTVTDEDISNGKAPAVVYLQPIRAIEYIPIYFTMTQDSVIFEDEESTEES